MKHIRALYQWTALLSVIILLGGQFSPASAQNSAQVGIFQAYEIQPGARVEIPIEIRNVQDLYAVDLEIHFDPRILTFEDADPQMDGIQPALGTFLDAGMVLYNTVDPEAGIIKFVMTQVNPSEPKSGSGVLIVLYAVGAAEGESTLEVVRADLSTREGIAIPSELVENSVKVAASAPEIQATPIPVQNPTSVIVIPTLTPTVAIPTEVPLPTSTAAIPTEMPLPTSTTTISTEAPLPTSTVFIPTEAPLPTSTVAIPTEAPLLTSSVAIPTATPLPTATKPAPTQTAVITTIVEAIASPTVVPTTAEQAGGFSLAQNWWILLIVAAAIVGVVIYLNTGKKEPPEDKQEEDK